MRRRSSACRVPGLVLLVGLTALLLGCGHTVASRPVPSRWRGTVGWLEGCWGAGSVDWFARERWAWRGGGLEGYSVAFGPMGLPWQQRLRLEGDGSAGVVLVVEHVSGLRRYRPGRYRLVHGTARELRFASGEGSLVVRRDVHSGGEWLGVGASSDDAGLARMPCERAE